MIKIAAAGLVTAIISIQLTKGAKEYQLLAAIACGAYILGFGLLRMTEIVEEINLLVTQTQIDKSYFTLILKCLGITYIGELSSSLCRDAGQTAIAEQIEMTAKLTILAMSLPVMSTLISTISDLIK